MKPIFMYGKDTMIYSEVTTKLLSEETRLGSEKNVSTENALVVKKGKKKNFGKVVCLRKSDQKVELVRKMASTPKLT